MKLAFEWSDVLAKMRNLIGQFRCFARFGLFWWQVSFYSVRTINFAALVSGKSRTFFLTEAMAHILMMPPPAQFPAGR